MSYQKVHTLWYFSSTNDKERSYLLKKIEEISKNTALAHNCDIEFKINPLSTYSQRQKECKESH